MQYTSLTPDKILNSLVYRTLFYVNTYGSFKLSKNSPVFGPPSILLYHCIDVRLSHLNKDNLLTHLLTYLETLHYEVLVSKLMIFTIYKRLF